jgi:uncharacterized membrane protein YbhN (UPF0104 family)
MCVFRQRWRLLIAACFLTGFVGWTAWYVWGHRQDFAIITQVPPAYALALYCLFIGTIVCNGLYTRDLLLVFDIRLRTREWFSLSVSTAAASFILPLRGGAGIRALYLKAHYCFSFSDFFRTLSAMYLMYFVVHGSMGILGMLLLWRQGSPFDVLFAVLFGMSTCLTATCLLWRFPIRASTRFPLRQVAAFCNSWALLRASHMLFIRLMAYTVVYTLVALVRAKVAFAAYGVDLSWGGAMFQAAGQSIAVLVSLTPGSLGVVELMSVYMGRSLSYTPAEALMVQALLRVVAWTTLLVLTPVALRILSLRSVKRSCTYISAH